MGKEPFFEAFGLRGYAWLARLGESVTQRSDTLSKTIAIVLALVLVAVLICAAVVVTGLMKLGLSLL